MLRLYGLGTFFGFIRLIDFYFSSLPCNFHSVLVLKVVATPMHSRVKCLTDLATSRGEARLGGVDRWWSVDGVVFERVSVCVQCTLDSVDSDSTCTHTCTMWDSVMRRRRRCDGRLLHFTAAWVGDL